VARLFSSNIGAIGTGRAASPPIGLLRGLTPERPEAQGLSKVATVRHWPPYRESQFMKLAVGLLAVFLLAATAPTAEAKDMTRRPCTYDKLPAVCGTLRVPEDRLYPSGRTIVLHFVQVLAQAVRPAAPIFFLDGGPGQSAISDFSDGLRDDPTFVALHTTHDFVLLDQRGTGLSHALQCRMYRDDSDVFAEIYPLKALRRCRERLARATDLSAYGTSAATDDLDLLRERLGYRKIILYGGSYGTLVALVYLRKHGDFAQSALLEGIEPPFFKIPLPELQAAQRALDALEQACARDAVCRTTFPHFGSEFSSLLKESTHGIRVDYENHSGEHVHAMLLRPVFANSVRLMLYFPSTAAWLPLLVHDAKGGNTTPLAKAIVLFNKAFNGGYPGGQAMGDNIGVDCQEGVAFITPAEAARESINTFMAGAVLEARNSTCAIWNVRSAESAFIDPVRSTVPVLMISGADDPATDPRYATRQLAYLANSRQIVIPYGGHGNDDPCITRQEIEFIVRSSAAELNASCIKKFARPQFATTLSALPKVLR
jgi:pimeloyl-ACP methyl ester carboxylesterase